MDDYQHAIERTLKQLEETKEKLIDQIFDLAINGELKEWSETIEIGEHFYFGKELFESLEDKNIKQLIDLIAKIENMKI
ncbi:hypothetical protein ACUN24_16320 [Pedobacter sp. WC2501]|uniref:hypothetical protein n=1 Tax=Pedobacter sp. WC2501 TaxID=3461400 RepID=UPI0040456E8E